MAFLVAASDLCVALELAWSVWSGPGDVWTLVEHSDSASGLGELTDCDGPSVDSVSRVDLD